MKLPMLLLMLGTAATLVAQQVQDSSKELVLYRLDNSRVFKINTYLNRGVTTVIFPGAIEGIAAGNVAMNKVENYELDGTPSTDFLLAYQPGNYYFSVKALKSEAIGTVNIVYGRRAYTLRLMENETEPMSTVTFSSREGQQGEAQRNYTPPSLAVLKGLMDKAKAFDSLKDKHPAALSNVQVCDNKCVSDYKDYSATVIRCWRFNHYNSLVFMVELKNNTDQTLTYDPKKTAFAVLDQHLYPALIDASGTMPPGSTTPAFFVVSTTADGRINQFSADNDWKVLINAKSGGVDHE